MTAKPDNPPVDHARALKMLRHYLIAPAGPTFMLSAEECAALVALYAAAVEYKRTHHAATVETLNPTHTSEEWLALNKQYGEAQLALWSAATDVEKAVNRG